MSEGSTKDYFKLAVKIIFFIILLIFLYFIRDIILIVLVSFIVAALFIPLVDWFEKKRVSRVLSTILIYLFLLFLLVGMIFIIIPIFSQEFEFFGEKISSYYQILRSFLDSDQKILPAKLFEITGLNGGWTFLGQGLFSFLGSVANWFFAVALIFILAFYTTIEKNNLIKFFISLFPQKYRDFISRLLGLVQKDLSAWGGGMVIMMLSVGILTYIGLLILGSRFAFILAIFAGLTEIIPWAGPFIGAIPAVFIAFFQSPMRALVIALLYILVQQIVNNIIAPQIMKRAVGLDPIVVITVLLIGAKIGGIFGAIIAIPATAIIYIFIREYLKLKKQLKTDLQK